jgi:hypothetical protein
MREDRGGLARGRCARQLHEHPFLTNAQCRGRGNALQGLTVAVTCALLAVLIQTLAY